MHNERSTFASNFFRRFFAHLSFLVPLAGGMHQHGRRRGVNTPWKRRKKIRTTLKNKAVFFHLLNCAASRIYAGWKKGRPVKPVKPFSLSRKTRPAAQKSCSFGQKLALPVQFYFVHPDVLLSFISRYAVVDSITTP